MHAKIFDLDGTLLHSMVGDSAIFVRSIKDILGSVDIHDDFGVYENVTDQGIVEQVLRDNGIPHDPKKVLMIKSHFVAELRHHIESVGPFDEVPGASSYLRKMQATSGVRVAVATGCWEESALLKLRSSGLDVAGIPVATSDIATSRTGIMRAAVDRLGDHFESITYFGDAQWDIDSCHELGWDFVAVGAGIGGITSYDELQQ